MKKKVKKADVVGTVFIRVEDAATRNLINEVMAATHCNVSTKALLQAGSIYLKQIKTIESLEKELQLTRENLREANDMLNRIHGCNVALAAYSKKFIQGKYPQGESY